MKNSKLKIIIFLLVVFFLFFIISESFAAVIFRPNVEIPGLDKIKEARRVIVEGKEQLEIPVDNLTLAWVIKTIYDWAIRAIILLAVVMMVVGGFQWVMAIGSAPIIGQAKARIGHAFMGLILAVGTYFILNFINPDLVRLKPLEKITDITGWELEMPSIEDLVEIYLFDSAKGGSMSMPIMGLGFYRHQDTFQEDEQGQLVAGIRLAMLDDGGAKYREYAEIFKKIKPSDLKIKVFPLGDYMPWDFSPFTKIECLRYDAHLNPCTEHTKVVWSSKDFINPKIEAFSTPGEYRIQVYFAGSLPEELEQTKPKEITISIGPMGPIDPCQKCTAYPGEVRCGKLTLGQSCLGNYKKTNLPVNDPNRTCDYAQIKTAQYKHDMHEKLLQLYDKNQDWVLSEGFPPTINHDDERHCTGMAADIAPTLEDYIDEWKVAKLNILCQEAKKVGFSVLNETKYSSKDCNKSSYCSSWECGSNDNYKSEKGDHLHLYF